MTTTEDRPRPTATPTPWTVWLATVALGGSMTLEELTATLDGSRAGSVEDRYLIAQAQNP